MIKQVFTKQDLPIGDLAHLGLVSEGDVQLDKDDMDALLAGRRTAMLRLKNLELDGAIIKELDAKISLKQNEDGSIGLLLHPIYREAEIPSFLTDTQAEQLEKGEIINLQKKIFGEDGKPKEVLIEFDKDTNEFIVTDTDRIQAPDMVNGKPLTEEQKSRYKKGREVKTEDGTTIQYSGTDKEGMRSDKLALIASILIDGGVSYMLYKGLHALLGKKEEKKDEKRGVGKNYDEAFKKMQEQEARQKSTILQPGEDFDEEPSRSMSY
jgi:hypothetical protein